MSRLFCFQIVEQCNEGARKMSNLEQIMEIDRILNFKSTKVHNLAFTNLLFFSYFSCQIVLCFCLCMSTHSAILSLFSLFFIFIVMAMLLCNYHLHFYLFSCFSVLVFCEITQRSYAHFDKTLHYLNT